METTNQVELWKGAAEAFDERFAKMTPEHHHLPTPCDEMDVSQLVDHAVGVQNRFGRLLGGHAPDGASWSEARAAMADALAQPGALEGQAEHPSMGPTDRIRLLAIATNDLLLHSWDLSRALGVDDTLPAANLRPAIDGVEAFPPEVRAMLFAAPLEIDPDADLQDRLLAVAGRRR